MHHLWGKFIEMTIDLSVKFDPQKNGSHLNDPLKNSTSKPSYFWGVAAFLRTMSCNKIDLLFSSGADNVPSIRNQSTLPGTSGVSPLTGKSWKTSRNSTTKQVGFRAWGGKSKTEMAFLLLSKSLCFGQSWVVACIQFAQKIPKRKEASNKTRKGHKNRSIMNQPLVLFCAKPLRLPNSMPSRIIVHQSVFVGAKKSPACNWGYPLAHL